MISSATAHSLLSIVAECSNDGFARVKERKISICAVEEASMDNSLNPESLFAPHSSGYFRRQGHERPGRDDSVLLMEANDEQ